jgi:hypothetical protein
MLLLVDIGAAQWNGNQRSIMILFPVFFAGQSCGIEGNGKGRERYYTQQSLHLK